MFSDFTPLWNALKQNFFKLLGVFTAKMLKKTRFFSIFSMPYRKNTPRQKQNPIALALTRQTNNTN